jgi:hypothetical protein
VDVVEAAVDECRRRYMPPPPLALDDASTAFASIATLPPPKPPLEFVLVSRSDSALPFPRERRARGGCDLGFRLTELLPFSRLPSLLGCALGVVMCWWWGCVPGRANGREWGGVGTAGSFDAVSSCFVLSGLPSPAAQLAFVARCGAVLAKGGRFCLLVNNPDSYGERFTSIQLEGPQPRSRSGGSGQQQRPARRRARSDQPAQGQPPPPPIASSASSRAAFTERGSAVAPAAVTSVEVVAEEEEDEDDGGEEAWVPGRVCKATFFDKAGRKAFACNDRWWPRYASRRFSPLPPPSAAVTVAALSLAHSRESEDSSLTLSPIYRVCE